LSADGNTLAVAAAREGSNSIGVGGEAIAQSNNEAPASGAVYVFIRSVDAIWSQQAYVKASNTEADDLFGFSLALSPFDVSKSPSACRVL
jgi:trimeric autotransporter adhesin